MKLWELRFGVSTDSGEELASFASWCISGKLDERWPVDQLKCILDRGKKAEPEYLVIKRLVETAPRYPKEAVECLIRLAEGVNWDFHVMMWQKEARSILETALSSEQEGATEVARHAIHRFGTHEQHFFRDLLPPSQG